VGIGDEIEDFKLKHHIIRTENVKLHYGCLDGTAFATESEAVEQ
jgi:hypothetical protein